MYIITFTTVGVVTYYKEIETPEVIVAVGSSNTLGDRKDQIISVPDRESLEKRFKIIKEEWKRKDISIREGIRECKPVAIEVNNIRDILRYVTRKEMVKVNSLPLKGWRGILAKADIFNHGQTIPMLLLEEDK